MQIYTGALRDGIIQTIREEAIENNVNSLISNKGNYKEKMNYSLKSTGTTEKLFTKKSHCISILYQNNLIDEWYKHRKKIFKVQEESRRKLLLFYQGKEHF